MAEASISWFQDQFSCSICLDLLKDPVTIPCGHSYCMSCITNYWNQDNQGGVYSCPQCRQTFTTRPALNKNTTLAELVEKLKKTSLETDQSDLSYAGPEDVQCDICTGRKYKAIKTCQVCRNSYCQTHFEHHEELQSGRRHRVIDVPRRLQEMFCPKHNILLVFCRTDQQSICLLCTMNEHTNHDIVSAATERTVKQKLLEVNQRKFQQRIKEKEKELQNLREAVKIHKISAQTAVEDSERIFTELIRSIERRRSEVTQLIRDREKTAVRRAEEPLKKLQQEIDDLKRRNEEMKKLSKNKDHISFLQSFPSVSSSPGTTENITVSSFRFFDVRESVTKLKKKMEDFCKEETEKISGKGKETSITKTFHTLKLFPMNPRSERTSYSISDGSLWIQPQHINVSVCLKRTERLQKLTHFSRIMIIQTDLILGLRCCVERVCVDAVTGRLS
ncbi:E3 ubiquitin/ISG15 ligase TRIM25-like isoform X2 [Misgurnus anguillicaudatus]|uniref:E3 ubiquitin/ISG15 ligase TRIM25-like isoform X2 n=1 Tax=Misgurnus anguillicaudatus TaxID=75329 RepID=UPI003CCF5298